MRGATRSAGRIADFLSQHPEVQRTLYPGRGSSASPACETADGRRAAHGGVRGRRRQGGSVPGRQRAYDHRHLHHLATPRASSPIRRRPLTSGSNPSSARARHCAGPPQIVGRLRGRRGSIEEPPPGARQRGVAAPPSRNRPRGLRPLARLTSQKSAGILRQFRCRRNERPDLIEEEPRQKANLHDTTAQYSHLCFTKLVFIPGHGSIHRRNAADIEARQTLRFCHRAVTTNDLNLMSATLNSRNAGPIP